MVTGGEVMVKLWLEVVSGGELEMNNDHWFNDGYSNDGCLMADKQVNG